MKNSYSFLFVLLLFFYITTFAQTSYYVTPDGSSSNDGSSFNSPMDLYTALDAVEAGDEIVLSGETFYITYTEDEKNTIELSKSGSSGNYITIRAEDGEIATIDFSFPDMAWVQDSYGFYVTGDYWYFKNIKITHAGYQGAYVIGGYNTFENCIFYDNRNTGLEINKGGNNTTVINCDAYYNYDPKKGGSMADGFGPKQTQGEGNKFIGCRAWYNSDDGFDCYDSPEIVTFENCWAFYNGIDVWEFEDALEFAGNGNGFKVGGNYELANNVLTNCIAFGHPGKGFDQNNNTGGLTIYNCTAYSNEINYGLGGDLESGEAHILKNNISLNSTSSISVENATETNNTWNSGFSVSESDFISLDLSLATVTRNSDGSIPETDLFRLNEESSLIDAGVDVGLDYSGSAPDLGAFEYEETSDESVITIQENNTGFCSVDGAVESDNSGYTGTGYANTDNETGTGVDYKITVGSAGTYSFIIRYATTSDRPANLIFNSSTLVSDISFPSTGAWTTYATTTFSAYLSSGTSDLRLEATSSNGLANIDYVKISGEDIDVADCNSTTTTYTLTTTVSGSGSVSPSSGTYDEGTTITLTASPESGWVFDNWSDGSTENPLTITMNSDVSLTANFTEETSTTIQIQENETGFCSVDGSVDDNNEGFSGDGFANTTNASGNGIDWAVTFGSNATYTFVFQYASTSDRPADLIIDGTTVVADLEFPSTGSWTTWLSVSTSASVSAGSFDVRLEATGSSGLANIDYIQISGEDIEAYDCDNLKALDKLLSIKSSEDEKGISIFPNPSKGSLTINFYLEQSGDLTINLYNLTGNLIDCISHACYNAGENSITYNNSSLKEGIYFITLQNSEGIKNLKLIID